MLECPFEVEICREEAPGSMVSEEVSRPGGGLMVMCAGTWAPPRDGWRWWWPGAPGEMVMCEGSLEEPEPAAEDSSLIWMLLGMVEGPAEEAEEEEERGGRKLVGSRMVVGAPMGDNVEVLAPPMKRSKSELVEWLAWLGKMLTPPGVVALGKMVMLAGGIVMVEPDEEAPDEAEAARLDCVELPTEEAIVSLQTASK